LRSSGSGKQLGTENLALPMAEILSQMENTVVNNLDIAPELGSTEVLKRKIRTARRRVRGEIPMGRTRAELSIPDSFLKTKTGDPFLLKDFSGEDRMIIFASPDSLKVTFHEFHILFLKSIL